MNKFSHCFVILLTLILVSQTCHAARLKAYVNRFSVSVPENRDELKVSLQTLLMSRLNSEEIQAVENQADADIQVSGSYIVFGTVFSLDVLAKTSSGVFIDRVFVQGDTQNELIPAVTEMARQLQGSILKWRRALTGQTAGDPAPPSTEKVLPTIMKKTLPPESKSVKKLKKVLPPESKPVNTPKVSEPQKLPKPPETPWVSHRLPETLNSMATGRTLADKGVEIFITGERYLRYYLKAKNMQFLTGVAFKADERIIGVDVADLDQDGTPEIYVTILKGGKPASQVYIPENNTLKKIADNIPYMLRGIALEGKEKKIFAQKLDDSDNFTGDIHELVKSGDSFTASSPMRLPLFGNLYNFNKFTDSKGKRFFIVAHPEGYLLVYSNERKQLWKSRDKFGGSETSLCQPKNSDPSSPLHTACSLSLPQRLLVTKDGEVIASRNSGLSTIDATRNYSKNNVIQLFWDGVSLKEKWRTGQSQNYLADFSYDDRRRELLLLEVEPAGNSEGERSSRVVMRTME